MKIAIPHREPPIFGEEWRSARLFPGYFVSNLGRVHSDLIENRRHKSGKRFIFLGKILKQRKTHDGYWSVTVNYNGQKMHHVRVHRLIADSFIENPYHKPFINHKDGNRLNNKLSNLEWCTPLENTRHAIEVLGHNRYGERGATSLLSNTDALDIRSLRFYGGNCTQIAKVYGLSRKTVSNITRNLSYKTELLWRD